MSVITQIDSCISYGIFGRPVGKSGVGNREFIFGPKFLLTVTLTFSRASWLIDIFDCAFSLVT